MSVVIHYSTWQQYMTKIKKGVMVMARSKSGKNRRRTQIRQQQKRRRKAQKS